MIPKLIHQPGRALKFQHDLPAWLRRGAARIRIGNTAFGVMNISTRSWQIFIRSFSIFSEAMQNCNLIETEGFGQWARDLVITPVGLLNLEITHPDS